MKLVFEEVIVTCNPLKFRKKIKAVKVNFCVDFAIYF